MAKMATFFVVIIVWSEIVPIIIAVTRLLLLVSIIMWLMLIAIPVSFWLYTRSFLVVSTPTIILFHSSRLMIIVPIVLFRLVLIISTSIIIIVAPVRVPVVITIIISVIMSLITFFSKLLELGGLFKVCSNAIQLLRSIIVFIRTVFFGVFSCAYRTIYFYFAFSISTSEDLVSDVVVIVLGIILTVVEIVLFTGAFHKDVRWLS